MGKQKRPWPRCEAPLKNGSLCNRTVARGENGPEGLCSHHLANPPAADVEPIVLADEEEPEVATVDESPQTVEKIGSIRAAIREGASTTETAELIQDLILDGLRASKDVYATCTHCKKRTPVALPDLSARVKAASELMNQIEGKLADGKAPAGDRVKELMDKMRHDIDQMTDDELLELAARTELGETTP